MQYLQCENPLQVYVLFSQHPPTNNQIWTEMIFAQTSSDTVAYSPLDSGVIVESGKVTIQLFGPSKSLKTPLYFWTKTVHCLSVDVPYFLLQVIGQNSFKAAGQVNM